MEVLTKVNTDVAGLRDVVAHKYQTVRIEDIYVTLVEDVPTLKVSILILLRGM